MKIKYCNPKNLIVQHLPVKKREKKTYSRKCYFEDKVL